MAIFNMEVTDIDEHDRQLVIGLFEALDNGLLFLDMIEAMVDKTIEERDNEGVTNDTFAKAIMLALLAYACSQGDNKGDIETITGFNVVV